MTTFPIPLPKFVPRTLVVALLLVSCGESGPRRVEIHDLAAELAGAEIRGEPQEIDFGSGASEHLLIEGFSWNESTPDGATFAWSDRPISAVELFIARPRPLRVRLNLLPLPVDDAPPQAVTVRLNSQTLGSEIELAAGWNPISIVLPIEAQQPGVNRFELSYRWTRSPDARHLAVAWDWLRLESLGEATPPPSQRPRAEGRRLALPTATHLDYFLNLPAGAQLTFDRLAVRGGGELRVELKPRGSPAIEVARIPSSTAPGSFDLGIRTASLVRLRLQTLGGTLAVIDGAAIQAPLRPTESTEAPIAETGAPPEPMERRPNLLVYLVDTLRADRLGCYGYARPTSPHLDAFAKEAIVFERAFAQSSWTKASVASIFAGIWPRAHGIDSPEDGFAATLETLPELLQDSGYRTSAVTTNAYISPEAGFARGFDQFVYLPNFPNRSNHVHRKAVQWLDNYLQEEDRAPFFLYLHTIDPHAPYAPPQLERQRLAPNVPAKFGSVRSIRRLAAKGRTPRREEVQNLSDLYDGEIAANDRQFGRLLHALRQRDLYRETLIVFLSDHGEAFREHGVFGHGWDLYRETLQIPLLIKPPGESRPGSRTASTAQHLDLLPTLLTAAGLEPSVDLPGRDLLAPPPPQAEGEPLLADRRRAFSFLRYAGRTGASLVQGDWHLSEPITHSFGHRTELFDLRADPLEQHDLFARNPVLGGYLRSQLRAKLSTAENLSAPPQTEIDEETRAGLRALGYIE